MKRKGSYCENQDGVNRGAWSAEEDQILINYVQVHGEGNWRELSKKAGLKRSGKSCRLRWLNYLKPDIKRGNISSDEQDLIIRLHSLLGNRWSLIAGRLPGRTDSEIKNYWNTYLRKKVEQNHNHNHNTPIELRIEAPGCSKNSLGIVIEPTKSSYPMSCTEAMIPDRIVNDFTSNWDQNPIVSTPQDDHDRCSEGFLKHFDTNQLLMPYDDCRFNDAIGDTWYENWNFDDYFPLGYNPGFSLF